MRAHAQLAAGARAKHDARVKVDPPHDACLETPTGRQTHGDNVAIFVYKHIRVYMHFFVLRGCGCLRFIWSVRVWSVCVRTRARSLVVSY